jgi:tetratricopeptide (TPR) repeat protein
VAALDCGCQLEAESYLLMLERQFPDSLQVKTLRGMKMESEERYEEALQWYDSLLEKNETNMPIRKRKIAILIAQKNVPKAIKALTEYLELFMSDEEAWLQLSELYLKGMDYRRAAFCVEELLVADPRNHLYHQHYAEMLYTMGGIENLDMARKYFAQSLKINPNNVRALYGFYLVGNKCTGLVLLWIL